MDQAAPKNVNEAMSVQEFLGLLEGQLDMPQGTLIGHKTLAGLNGWDSMAAVVFMALADERLGITLSGDDIAKAKRVDDLLSLVRVRLAS